MKLEMINEFKEKDVYKNSKTLREFIDLIERESNNEVDRINRLYKYINSIDLETFVDK